jgi:hypothetical protein
LLGECVGVDSGDVGVQHGQPRVVDLWRHKHRWRRPAFASAGGQGDWPVAASRRSTRPYGRLGAAASVVARAVDKNKVAMSWLRPG